MLSQVNCTDYDAGCYTSILHVGAGGTVKLEDLGDGNGVLTLGPSGLVGVASLANSHLGLYNGHHHGVAAFYWDWFAPINDGWWQLGYDSLAWRKTTTYVLATKPETLTCAATTGACMSSATPHTSSVRFDCQDADGCEYAPGVGCFTVGSGDTVCTSDGQQLCVTNVNTNTLVIRDAAGATELVGGFMGGKNASLCLEFVADRWVEKSRAFP